MTILLGILMLFFLIMFLYEHWRYRNQAAEITEVNDQLTEIMDQDSSRMVLVPSGNAAVKKMAANINRLLVSEYQTRSNYQRTQTNIQSALTNISHDLKTPLTVMLGYLEMLQIKMRKNCNLEEMVTVVEKIHAKTQEISGMINQFFDITRLESGDMILKMEKQYLSNICREVMFDYYDLLRERDYVTDIHIPEAPVYAMGDENGLRRILKNLIDNAINHGSDRKYLGVCLEVEDDIALVKIEDHGKGLTEAEAERVFDRNYTGTRRGASTGLGLSIAKKIAVSLNGDLEVASVPGIQTVFTLRIPKC